MSDTEFKDYVKYDLQKSFYEVTYNDEINVMDFKGKTLVNLCNLDVNYFVWHNGLLDGHQTFKFDYEKNITLTPENYEEFKQVVKVYLDVIDNFREHHCYVCGAEDVKYYDDDGDSCCTKCKNEIVKTRAKDLLNI